MRDFYDSLFVQCLLQHAQNGERAVPNKEARTVKEGVQSSWHSFLDNLCFLCDVKRAGKTVVSIGAQATDQGITLRLSTRPAHRDFAVIAVRRTIASLKASLQQSQSDKEKTVEALALNAIEWSEEKICNYYGRLQSVLSDVSISGASSLNIAQNRICMP